MPSAGANKPSGEHNYGILAALPDAEIQPLIASGASLTAIARQFGVCHQAVHQHIESRPALKDARLVGYQARMDKRESELEVAADQVAISRARELLGHARWLAERGAPAQWGNRSQLEVTVNHVLADKLRQAERVIEHDATQQIEQITDETGKE